MDNLGKLYFLSGIANTIGLCMFNRMYTTSSAIASFAPSVFAIESQLLINVWGLAYMATAKKYKKMPALSFVFFIEKMLYVYWWYILIVKDENKRDNAIEMVRSGKDILTGAFCLGFGLNDFLFGIVFAMGTYRGLTAIDTDTINKKK